MKFSILVAVLALSACGVESEVVTDAGVQTVAPEDAGTTTTVQEFDCAVSVDGTTLQEFQQVYSYGGVYLVAYVTTPDQFELSEAEFFQNKPDGDLLTFSGWAFRTDSVRNVQTGQTYPLSCTLK